MTIAALVTLALLASLAAYGLAWIGLAWIVGRPIAPTIAAAPLGLQRLRRDADVLVRLARTLQDTLGDHEFLPLDTDVHALAIQIDACAATTGRLAAAYADWRTEERERRPQKGAR